jgi:tetratricopeptide (TPR) repeat protein
MSSSETLIKTANVSETSGVSNALRKSQYHSLSRQRECLKATASVVAITSASLGQPAATTTYGSEFDAIFPPEPTEFTRSWVEENHIPEDDEPVVTLDYDGHLEGQFHLDPAGDPDHDVEIELDMAKALLQQGRLILEEQDWKEAESRFQDAVYILGENISGQNSEISILWLDAISSLIEVQKELRKWENAKRLLKQKLAFHQGSFDGPNLPIDQLQDVLALSKVLCENKEFREAQAQAKKAEKAFEDQGPSGVEGRKQALELLIRVCHAT